VRSRYCADKLDFYFKIDIFTDSIVLLNKIKKEHKDYALVLSDVRMPGLTGVELGKRILQIDKDIKIILISAFELMEETSFELVKKPVPLTELLETVRTKIRGRT
jgi:FixJ family two-component response regulator